jgi:molecular chaperone GrpE
MSDMTGGRQPGGGDGWRPGRGGGEPPHARQDVGSAAGPPEAGPPESGPADTGQHGARRTGAGPHGAGRTDGGDGADGPGDVATEADLQARLAEAEDQKLRALADLDNLRKRCAAQAERAEANARTEVARQWLPVVDNLERALEHATADPRAIVEGIQAVRQQALGVLAGLGFARRDDTGAAFDPARHEAVATTYDPRVPPGTVVQVVRPGYGEPDRQLRPAQVVVAKAD